MVIKKPQLIKTAVLFYSVIRGINKPISTGVRVRDSSSAPEKVKGSGSIGQLRSSLNYLFASPSRPVFILNLPSVVTELGSAYFSIRDLSCS